MKIKRKFIFIFLTIFSLSLCAQQSAQVIYKVVKIPEHPLAQKILQQQGQNYYNRRIKKYEKIYEITEDFTYILQFNAKESRYEWQEEMRDETVNEYVWILGKLLGGGMSVKYQNRRDSLLMSQFVSPVDHKKYREISSLYQQEWSITNETDTILGYPVIKAVNGRYVAWFAPKIPVPFGPNGSGGLPGLILKLYNKKQFPAFAIVATQIHFYKKPIKIKKPKKGILRTQSQGRATRIKNLNKL